MSNYSLYELVWIFIIYAFLGWCIEVIIAAVQTGRFVNRGVLNGLFCPIYGFGVVAVIVLLTPVRWNLPVLFVGSVLLTSSLEFVTGYILEKSFNRKWWDYTGERFNIRGYVCLRTSISWGVGCIIVVYVLQSITYQFIHWIPVDIGIVILDLLISVLIVDTIITISSLLKVRQKIYILDEIGDKIGSLSSLIGKNISDDTIIIKDKYLRELEHLNKKYQVIFRKKVFGYDRITKAFPRLRLISSHPKS